MYLAIREGIEAGRRDARLYGTNVYNGNDKPGWYSRNWVMSEGGEHWLHAYERAYRAEFRNIWNGRTKREALEADRVHEENQTVWRSNDPGLVREIRSLAARIEKLETNPVLSSLPYGVEGRDK